MSFEFKLPDLGEGIVEGEVVKWLAKEGDEVKEDTPLLEVMTDKATVEITSPKNGNIEKILIKEGDIVQVEQVMVLIKVAGGEDTTPSKSKETSTLSTPPTPSSSVERGSGGTMVKASPATRKLARELNIDLGRVKGSGPGGRIMNTDLEQFSQRGRSSSQPTSAPNAALQSFDGEVERIPFRGLRKKISENMQRSTHNAAHFSYVDTVDMTELVKLREYWKKEAAEKGIKVTFLPFMMKATVEALKKYPRFNASLDKVSQEIVLKKYYNLGIATATERGLIVPVIRDVDKKDLMDIARELAELTERTRAFKASPEELKGSSFTLTSLGAMGGLFATPIINYPETAIMGIYQIKPTPVVFNDEITIRQIMYFSLSLDHRVIDGHEAAIFGNEFKKYLESPNLIFKKLY